MTIFRFTFLALLLLFSGCFGSSTADQDVSAPETENVVSGKNNIESDETGYLTVLGGIRQQNYISNRMENNFARLTGAADPVQLHHFQSAGLKVHQPVGMKVSDLFTGFVSENSEAAQATFVIMTNPFSMEESTSNLVSEELRNENTKILFNKDVKVDGKTGEFYLTRQPFQNIELAKYTLVFGDDDFSWIVTASFDVENEESIAEPLLTSLLNLQISDTPRLPPGEDVDFQLTPNRLILTDGFIDKVVFTVSGIYPVHDSKQPVFQAGKTLANFSEAKHEQMAANLISPSRLFKVNMISSKRPVEIDGLKGFEFVVVGEDLTNGEPLWLYSTTLFGDNDTYLFHGWVSSDNQENYITDFRALTESFKRK